MKGNHWKARGNKRLPIRPRRAGWVLAGGLAMLGLALALAMTTGAAEIPWATFWDALLDFNPDLDAHLIVREMRLPRVLTCALTGVAFAVAGAVMQGMTENPLADPGLLGINAGAGLALAICLAFFPGLPFGQVVIWGFFGATLGALLVYGIASIGGGANPTRLVLAGAAVAALLTALSGGISIYYRIGQQLTFWVSGGVAGSDWGQLKIIAIWISLGLVGAIGLAPSFTMLNLGEETAAGLGLKVSLVRLGGAVLVLLLAGTGVAAVGAIGFLGLIVPHLARFLVGVDYRWIIPCAAILGSLLMVLADIGARLVNPPYETPVGALIALIGVPFFLILARRRERTGGSLPGPKATPTVVRRGGALIWGLLLLVALVFTIGMRIGFISLTPGELWQTLLGMGDSQHRLIVWEWRLPRLLIALLTGTGLALSGCILQGISQNPLADPGILGINAGAGLAVVLLVMAFPFHHAAWLPVAALLGAGLAVLVVYGLAYQRQGGVSPEGLVLNGIAVAGGISALLTVLVLRLNPYQYQFVTVWLAGNISESSWDLVRAFFPWIMAFFPYLLYKGQSLNVLNLGEPIAVSVGAAVKRERLVLLGTAAGLAGACVAVSGGIGFIGLVGPHLARRLVGHDYRRVFPVAALLGSILLMLADILARVMLKTAEIPIGIVMAIIGAPYFLYLLARADH